MCAWGTWIRFCGVWGRVTAAGAGIAGRVAIGVRGRERSRVCVDRISGEYCVSEPTGEEYLVGECGAVLA